MTCKHGNHSMHCGWCEDQARIIELESEVKALRKQIQDNALQQLASEGQWIELTRALRADAERYRWLRHGDNDEHVLRFADGSPVPVMSVNAPPPCFLLREEALDAAIDAARKG